MSHTAQLGGHGLAPWEDHAGCYSAQPPRSEEATGLPRGGFTLVSTAQSIDHQPNDPRDKPVGLGKQKGLLCINQPNDPRDKPVGLTTRPVVPNGNSPGPPLPVCPQHAIDGHRRSPLLLRQQPGSLGCNLQPRGILGQPIVLKVGKRSLSGVR
jgi:hypothetical protein